MEINNKALSTPPKTKDTKAGWAGYGTAVAVGTVGSVPSNMILNKVVKMGSSLPEQQKGDVFEAVGKALQNSGIAEKVKLNVVNEKTPLSLIGQAQVDAVDKMKLPKKFAEYLKNAMSPEYSAAQGKNAFFAGNQIIYNQGKMPLAPFHEMGHGINYHSSKIGKTLLSMRKPAMALPGLILIAALATKSKSRAEQEGKPEKKTVGTFVRDNAGKLSFAAMLPIVAEETLATIRGNKLAKQVLSPDMYKKVRNFNALAGCTYLIGAVATGLAAYAAVKVKDKMVANKIAKENAAKAQQANA